MRYTIIILAILWVTSCQIKTDSSIDADAVNQEIKDRKIKKLSDSQITEAVYSKGQQIAKEALSSYDSSQNLCDLGTLPSILAKYPLLLKRVSVTCKDDTILDKMEKMVWDAYKHDFNSQLELKDNVQKLDSGMFLYTVPKILQITGNEKSLAMISFVLEQKEIIRGL